MQKVPRAKKLHPKAHKSRDLGKASEFLLLLMLLRAEKICILSCHNFFKTVQNTSDDLELEKSLVHRARLSFQGKGLFL